MRSATLSLALARPAETDRGELSMGLLRAILAVAFGQMKLHRVEVAVLVSDWRAIACYKQLGFISEGVLREALRFWGIYGDQRIMSILRHEWLWRQRPRPGRAQTHAFPEP